MPITMDDAVLQTLNDPRYRDRLADTFLGVDLPACGERYRTSGEFAEIQRILGAHSRGAILDLGAGNGIASYAFARHGAHHVVALEPSPSGLVGRSAIHTMTEGRPVSIVGAYGEEIPLPAASVDVVFARQVLHHTRSLSQVLRECHRVLKSGGLFLACREHVADNEAQLRSFLADHPLHRLVGGEHAYPLEMYCRAIQQSQLVTERMWGPWDSVINAFPGVHSQADLPLYAAQLLASRLGRLGRELARVPGAQWLTWRYLNRPVPGRLYSFLARKP